LEITGFSPSPLLYLIPLSGRSDTIKQFDCVVLLASDCETDFRSLDDSVGIARSYGQDGRGRRFFSLVYSFQTGSGGDRDVKLTTHLHLVPRLRMMSSWRGAYPTLPLPPGPKNKPSKLAAYFMLVSCLAHSSNPKMEAS
jgi:hypothetical protein